eukprot:TRINITY_DN95769_c0_g1_i1.p1 TRINITY_DN95769_c0_g1~~TRINITY_DN95769_c0_g1_i1.p1  ORF type:complete len:209 (+),score=41.11 TRINITY_DN95769_c0_g1_i1:61-687(+)
MAAAIVASGLRERNHEAQEAAEKDGRHRLASLFESLDETKTGTLNRDEVTQLLTTLNSGETPSFDEVTFVMRMAGNASANGEIAQKELVIAIQCWRTYQSTFASERGMGRALFDKYDTDRSGKLDRVQLKAMLNELNGDADVSEADVDWVLSRADLLNDGQISKIELNQAIAAWFQCQRQHDLEAKGASEKSKASTGSRRRSAVCTLL